MTTLHLFQQLRERLIPFVQDLLSTHMGGEILIVSHSIAIQLLMAFFEGKPLERLWEAPILHPGAHSIVEASGDGGFTVLRYADAPWPRVHPEREPVGA